MKTIQQQLRLLGACASAREWAEGKTASDIWSTCKRGDWLLWWAGRLSERGTDERKLVVVSACDCAELELSLFEARYQGDRRPRTAIETARRWARGAATIEDVRSAAYAAHVAAADAYAVDDAAADAAAEAAARAAAAADAADAAYAAIAANAAGVGAARLRQCADIVRKWIPVMPEIEG